MAVLDRYLIRQIVPTFLLALSVLTFLLTINPMLDYLRLLLAKGVPLAVVGQLLLTLLPQGASLTFPMAFLTAVLMALGRTYLQAGRSDEAARAFSRIVDEFPQSVYAADARREREEARKG